MTFTVQNDALIEGAETAGVSISNPSAGLSLGATTSQNIVITDDDFPSVELSASANSGTEADGTVVTLTATASQAVAGNQTVNIAASGTGITAGDFTLSSTSITILDGQTTGTATFTVQDDALVEGSETATVSLSNPSAGITLGGIQSQDITLLDDDEFSFEIERTTDGAENNAGSPTDALFTITVSPSNTSGSAFTGSVAYSGTATNGTDYATGVTSFSIGDNESSTTITLDVTEDAVLEGNETIIATISNPSSGVISTASATANLSDDDNAAVTIADVSGNENDGAITVTATLDNAVQGGFSVDLSTADGTATTADNDYSAVLGQTLTFSGNAGETQTFTVTPTPDNRLEANESLTISQSNLAATSLAVTITDSAIVTINNDDTASVTIADVSANEDDGAITVTATLDNAVQGGFSVDLGTADGTATIADNDYTAVTGQTLTFSGSAGETQTFTVTPTVDNRLEPNETLTINQSNLAATSLAVTISDSATLTINNDDAASITIADVSGNENNGAITVTAVLNNAVAGGFTVNASTTDASATVADSDYTAVSNQLLTFAGNAGESQTFTVTPIDDATVEANETLTVGLSGLAATSLGVNISDSATVTINNDDAAAVTLADASGNENDGTITVTATLDNGVQGGFTIQVSTVDGTATIADNDYSAVAGQTLTFSGNAGETQTFTIAPTADSRLEPNETLTVSQSNLAATSLAVTITDSAIVTINNDDTASVIIDDVSGNEDDGAITVTATLDNAVQGGFTVDLSTADGTATTVDNDYTAVTGQTLTFSGNAGETQTFTVTPTVDNRLEANETLSISQSNLAATGLAVTIADSATLTITNDDAASVTIADASGNEDDGVISLTATLDNAVQGGFTVDVNTVDGTATTANSDYTAIVGQTLTFAGNAGETQTFSVTPTTDLILEDNETLTINQSNLGATGLAVGIADSATITINNDDSASVTISDVSGNEDDGTITITATLNGELPGGFSINLNSADGSATLLDNDYVAIVDQTLVFAGTSGETQTLDLSPVADDRVEGDETIVISQSDLSGTALPLTISDSAIVTLLGDDSATVTIEDVSANEQDGAITVTATLDKDVPGGFSVDLNTADDTATVADNDYVQVTDETLTFVGSAGETQTFTVTVNDDVTLEADETVTVQQSNLTGTGLSVVITDEATLTISNDDTAAVSIEDITQNEDDGSFTVDVVLDNPVDGGFSVDLTAVDGTATVVGLDYEALVTETLTFVGNVNEIQQITLTPLADDLVEPDETLTLVQSNLIDTELSVDITDQAEVTLSNDDTAEFNIAATSQAIEGQLDGVFTITSTNALATPTSIDISLGGTATQGVDYTTIGTSIVFPANVLSSTLIISVVNDVLDEANETVIITLNGATAAATSIGGQDSAVITIQNVLPALNLQLDRATVSEDAGISAAIATVTRTDVAVDSPLNINLSSNDAPRVILPTNVVIQAGQASATFAIGVIDNLEIEENQTVIITASVAGLVDANIALTVLNNDFDADGDGFFDDIDNCPNDSNPDQADFEGDGMGDVCDLDRDGDGMPDSYEIENGLNPLNSFDRDADDDNDGFTNFQEFRFGTDPQVANQDLDSNGVPDLVNVRRFNITPILQLLLLDN